MTIPTKLCSVCGINQCVCSHDKENPECIACWVKRNNPQGPTTEPTQHTIRSLSSSLEGVIVRIDCMVATTDVFKTVTTQIDVSCEGCGKTQTVIGNGYENPKIPNCKKCHIKMTKIEESEKTLDFMDIVLEEFLEEAEHNRPIYYDAKVFGHDVKTVFDGQRKRVTCLYKSIEAKDGKTNTPVLLVDEIKDLDEPPMALLSQEEIELYTKQAKEDPSYLKKIINSFASHIEGNYDNIKESMLLSLTGGSEGVTRRTERHILIVGNPGKAKSELLKKAVKTIGKGCYIIGMNSSKAGLGSGMVKMANGTQLPRAGVLVSYSGGLVCTDELDKMHGDDRKGMLESMEQGTVTIVKSGVEQQRTARPVIIAGCNPQYGEWDWDEGIIENINLESYLIQRFDEIWNITEHSEQDMRDIALKVVGLSQKEKEKLCDESTLKRFVNTIRPLKPTIKESAKQMIVEYFLKVSKRTDSKKTLPMDVRQLEGLMRTTTALAKWQFKQEADEQDVQEAIRLHKESLLTFGIDTHGDVQQMKLVEKQLSREQKIEHVLNDCLNQDGQFVENDYLNLLMEQNLFKSPESCKKWFNSQIGEKFLMCGNGKYRKSGT